MGILRSITRATNPELRDDLDALQRQVDASGGASFQTFLCQSGVVSTGRKLTFRNIGDSDITDLRFFLSKGQTSGALLTVDVRNGGISILSTKATFDNGERTSKTATNPVVIAYPSVVDDSELEVRVLSLGDSSAEDLGVSFVFGAYTGSLPSYDSDAFAFIAAASITDDAMRNAINDFVIGAKSAGVWSKCVAIYPFVGGSSGSHAVNLKSPGTYNLTFNGGVTHSSTGVLWDGSSGYAQTGVVPDAVLTLDSAHLSYYSRTANTDNRGDMGAYSTGSYFGLGLELYYNFSSSHKGLFICYDGSNANDSPFFSTANTDSQGYYVGTRTSDTSCVIYKNNTSIGSNSSSSYNTQPSHEIIIGAENNSGTPINWSNRECAFATIGHGLSGAESSSLYTLVQAFQTALGRQV